MKIGFIGCGNMGSAMIGGILRQGIFSKEDIIVSNLTPEGKARSEKNLGVVTTLDNKEVVRSAKTVVLAVKPQFYEEVLDEVHDSLTEDRHCPRQNPCMAGRKGRSSSESCPFYA